ncbi:MAG: DUF6350 family protein [Nocardioides sp.]|uniref:cell division protein PerM n=1 Tax=Nocardioides sp. TaxID=35761 RepID=UPI003EFD5F4B
MASSSAARPVRRPRTSVPGASGATPRTAPRSLVLTSTLGALTAALGPLVVLLAVGVVGWFLSDSGVHGAPRDGMRVGALAWLAAHGSGLSVSGTTVTIVPLGLTACVAWTVWRTASRVGEGVSSCGPDAHRLADGERDWTVPAATAWFVGTYLLVALVTATVASATSVGVSLGRVAGWSLALGSVVALPAIAIGSGRAAIWASALPAPVVQGLAVARSVVVAFALTCLAVFLGALALHLDDAATIFSTLHTSAGEATLYGLVSAAYVPNAAGFTASFLFGPGFTVGTGNVVTLAGTVLGPMPLFPLLAALPGPGVPPVWFSVLTVVPGLVAALAAYRSLARGLPLRWDHTLLAGAGGGLLAAFAVALLVAVSGGAAGPGLMADVGAPAVEVLAHALASFGAGGLVGALAVAARQGRFRTEPDGAEHHEPYRPVPEPGATPAADGEGS